MRRDFCTYFDVRYLARGLALAASLRAHCSDHRLWALCLDEESHAILRSLDLPNVTPIAIGELEAADPALAAARTNRTLIEYYFTCTPSLVLHIFQRDAGVSMLTYLDADLFFFSSPEPVFDEIGAGSLAIVPHRFPASTRRFEEYGLYNVGWITFRRGPASFACLAWWRDQCLAWCHDRVEGDRFADQKYLNTWPAQFDSVHVIDHKGVDVASWNLANYRVTRGADGVMVDDQPLVVFHFHHLKRRRAWLFETDLGLHGIRLNGVLKRYVYTPYCRLLTDMEALVAGREGRAALVGDRRPRARSSNNIVTEAIRDARAGNLLWFIGGSVR